ncbi:MAG TPA: spore coat U domain-containing protein [Sphingomicrobium sp.]|nr:spore coat U domain-containing protein [Sphingomicrobium sp.]
MNRFMLTAVGVSGALLSQSAWAATETANMEVSASVSTVCTLATTPLAFGEVAISGTTDGTATVSVNCTGGGAYTVGLGNGLHNVVAQRKLQSGANLLNYNLFKEVGHTSRWGDAGAELVSGTGSDAVQNLTVYGQIASGQTLVSGNGTPYTDTILVSVNY